jgi:streptomycin 6-kinase
MVKIINFEMWNMVPPKFEENILRIHGSLGEEWLKALPQLIEEFAKEWQLSGLHRVDNLSYNYVLPGWRLTEPIILKLGPNPEDLRQEATALEAFNGRGMAGLFASDDRALLIERATPGISLKKYFPKRDDEAIEITCALIRKLHGSIGARERVFLHADLHHENILSHGDSWIAIDPKGEYGELAYEATTFIINPIPELLKQTNAQDVIGHRIRRFANYFEITASEMTRLVRAKVDICLKWATEDGGQETAYFKKLLELLETV